VTEVYGLFLDIDGVLVTPDMLSRRIDLNVDPEGTVRCTQFNPECVSAFNQLLRHTEKMGMDVRIVVSSAWRVGRTSEMLSQILIGQGVHLRRDQLIGKTPAHRSGHRGTEIGLWNDDRFRLKSFVIVDDCGPEHLTPLDHHLVPTRWITDGGFRHQHIGMVVDTLLAHI
jgi:hypothetical protein